MFYYIYRTTNLIDDKFYIGVHAHFTKFDSFYFGSGRRITRAIKKYGKENFKVEVLSYHSNLQEAFREESKIVNEELLSNPLCYNLNIGGKGGSRPGHIKNFGKIKLPRTQAQKDAISKALTGKSYLTPEGKQRIVEANKGNQYAKGMTYAHSDDAKEKIAQSRLGKIWDKDMRQRMSSARMGKALGNKNAMANPENRAKVGASKIGRKRLSHPTWPFKMVHPNTPQWNELILIGYK